MKVKELYDLLGAYIGYWMEHNGKDDEVYFTKTSTDYYKIEYISKCGNELLLEGKKAKL